MKRHYPDLGGRHDEIVQRNHGSQCSELKEGRTDVVCQEDSSPSHEADDRIIIEQFNKVVAGRFSRFFVEFADVLLQAKPGEECNAAQLFDFVTDICFSTKF